MDHGPLFGGLDAPKIKLLDSTTPCMSLHNIILQYADFCIPPPTTQTSTSRSKWPLAGRLANQQVNVVACTVHPSPRKCPGWPRPGLAEPDDCGQEHALAGVNSLNFLAFKATLTSRLKNDQNAWLHRHFQDSLTNRQSTLRVKTFQHV